MELDPDLIRETIETGIARRRSEWHLDEVTEPSVRQSREARAVYDSVDEVVDSLVKEHGDMQTLAELRKAKDDGLIALAISTICVQGSHRLGDFFTGREIVGAALTHLLGIEPGTATAQDGDWAWSALWQHDDGTTDHFADDEHFSLLLELIDRAPMDDTVLFCIGDGPLSHAAANADRYARIQELSVTDPKIARAWWLNVTDGGRLEVPGTPDLGARSE